MILPEGREEDVGNAGLVQSTQVVGTEPKTGDRSGLPFGTSSDASLQSDRSYCAHLWVS